MRRFNPDDYPREEPPHQHLPVWRKRDLSNAAYAEKKVES